MFEKIFKRSKKVSQDESGPDLSFGRYSDNNKTVKKVAQWNEAERLFKEKKYGKSIAAFFQYLLDEDEKNVVHEESESGGRFELYQGSKIIRGYYNSHTLKAEALLARMPQPGVPVMRRLLELNFSLYYSRFAVHNDTLCMLFDSDIQTSGPGKLYYGLRELAIKADKQDDLLVQDFTSLQVVDTTHIQEMKEEEKAIRYTFFQQWIQQTLELIAGVDADKFSGGIAYLLLALAFRIDYLIVPQGKLLMELEKIVDTYFTKDDRPVPEKSTGMMDGFTRLLSKSKAEFYPYLMRSRYTFSIANPQPYKVIADAIYNANQNIAWYKENKYPVMAAQISEYGFSYCQYSYSLPRPVSELFQLFMMVNYPDYFTALGFSQHYYDTATGLFHTEAIIATIQTVQQSWQEKYPCLNFNTGNLKFGDKVSFNQSFTTEVEHLNMESK